MVNTTWRWGTGARTLSRSFSANSAARLAWQLGQKLRVWQEKARRCSSRHLGQRMRASPARENNARSSPSGKYLAYVSNESGQNEVYLPSFPSGTGRWQVSRGGGSDPTWRADGGEIYFLGADNRLNVVDTDLRVEVLLGQPKPIFFSRLGGFNGERTRYMPSPDGQRFLFAAPPQGTRLLPISLVINWTEDLKRR
jgi:hypothetical protein